MGASSAGSLPRCRQQVKDMRRKKQDEDPLFSIMFMCKAEEGKGKEPFVRLVNAAPYPMMLLAYDYTLDDLHRFCTNESKFSILGVDPTFSLGEFDVTVTTYQHLMLFSRTTSKHPVMIGPIFVHVKKDFTAYHFFTSSLVGQRPSLRNLRAFGTDGELALANALSASFPSAVHLRCFLHFKENIERKLHELSFPTDVANEVVTDIMGKPSQYQLGLVDAQNVTHFDEMLSNIESKWNELEKKFNSPPVFFSWFWQYQRSVVIESMTQEARIKGGLGNPPTPYYTNEVESKNDVLKQHVSYKASDLPKFVDHMKDLLQEQRNEVQRSVISQGEYHLEEEFKSYAIDQAKWFTLDDQRKRRVDKFMKAELPMITAKSPDSSHQGSSSNVLMSSLPLDQLALPRHFSRSLWSKAQALSTDMNGMVNCPGDHTSWMVKSESGPRPHFVRAAKGGGYLCDDTCLAYKSSKTCSHSVAVALKTGNLDKYIKWYSTTKQKGPNMT